MSALRLQLLPLFALLAGACSAPAQPEAGTGNGDATAGGATSAGAPGGGSAGGGTLTAGSGGESAGSGGAGGASATAGTGGAAGSAGTANGGTSGAGGSPPEGVPPGYTLQFEESFASPESLSKLVFANPDDWQHVADGGGYVEFTGFSYAPPYYSPRSVAVVASMMFQSFVLEVEILQTSMSGGHRDNCIFWGMANPSQFYYAHIGQMHDGAAHNIHIVNDADRSAITQVFTDGFDWGTDWQKFRVVRDVDSGAMAVYANGGAEPILTAADTALGEGYVGFGAFDDTGQVRNVKIWAPTATAQPAAFFTAK